MVLGLITHTNAWSIPSASGFAPCFFIRSSSFCICSLMYDSWSTIGFVDLPFFTGLGVGTPFFTLIEAVNDGRILVVNARVHVVAATVTGTRGRCIHRPRRFLI